jgi:hypothetical protein
MLSTDFVFVGYPLGGNGRIRAHALAETPTA